MFHDETTRTLAQLLLGLDGPVAMGVIHRRQAIAFDTAFWSARPQGRRARVETLLHRGNLLDRRDRPGAPAT
jgi:hypothetical protein